MKVEVVIVDKINREEKLRTSKNLIRVFSANLTRRKKRSCWRLMTKEKQKKQKAIPENNHETFDRKSPVLLINA